MWWGISANLQHKINDLYLFSIKTIIGTINKIYCRSKKWKSWLAEHTWSTHSKYQGDRNNNKIPLREKNAQAEKCCLYKERHFRSNLCIWCLLMDTLTFFIIKSEDEKTQKIYENEISVYHMHKQILFPYEIEYFLNCKTTVSRT